MGDDPTRSAVRTPASTFFSRSHSHLPCLYAHRCPRTRMGLVSLSMDRVSPLYVSQSVLRLSMMRLEMHSRRVRLHLPAFVTKSARDLLIPVDEYFRSHGSGAPMSFQMARRTWPTLSLAAWNVDSSGKNADFGISCQLNGNLVLS